MRRESGILQQIEQAARQDARRLGHGYVGVEHLFSAMLRIENGVTAAALQRLGQEPRTVRRRLREHVGAGEQTPEGEQTGEGARALTPRAERVLQVAGRLAEQERAAQPGEVHLLVALMQDGPNAAVRVVWELGLEPEAVSQAAVAVGRRQSAGGRGQEAGEGGPVLERGRDLTALARQGELHEVIGRRAELTMLAQTLCRKDKNNAVLLGEAGVGKTAIVEGLAFRIARGDVHPELQGKRVIELSASALVAGTTMRGEFEQRMQNLLTELRAQPEVIVFFDEIHTLLGAGAGQGSSMDAPQILKPALARGEIRCIGATTIAEHRRYVEADPALERRFQPLMVNEPSPEVTLEILQAVKGGYERHHGVSLTDEVLEEAVRLAGRYVPDRRFPDKALDLLDQACARTRMARLTYRADGEAPVQAGQSPAVTRQTVAEVVAQWTGRPATELTEDDRRRMLRLEEDLRQYVVGQDHALEQIAGALRAAAAGLRERDRPQGVFLFLGPTGVGKTELAKELARFLFGSREAMLRLDMSEYMEKHNVARLIGAPPGYVGHEEEGQLTGPLRTRPHTVVLLDEVEKAHPDVWNLFLQVFDDGRLTDAKGRTTDCRDATFIMTSNVGAESPELFSADPDDTQAQERLRETLLRHFRPEFLNRLDELVVFRPLAQAHIRQIAGLMVDGLRNRLTEERRLNLHLTESAWEALVAAGYDPQFGARPLRRAIERLLTRPLSELLLAEDWGEGETVVVSATPEGLSFERMNAPGRTGN